MGRTFPAAQRTQNSQGEQDRNSVPTSGSSIGFKLYWGTCLDRQRADQNCLNAQSTLFDTSMQTVGSAWGS